jgi:hypothetical protein
MLWGGVTIAIRAILIVPMIVPSVVMADEIHGIKPVEAELFLTTEPYNLHPEWRTWFEKNYKPKSISNARAEAILELGPHLDHIQEEIIRRVPRAHDFDFYHTREFIIRWAITMVLAKNGYESEFIVEHKQVLKLLRSLNRQMGFNLKLTSLEKVEFLSELMVQVFNISEILTGHMTQQQRLRVLFCIQIFHRDLERYSRYQPIFPQLKRAVRDWYRNDVALNGKLLLAGLVAGAVSLYSVRNQSIIAFFMLGGIVSILGMSVFMQAQIISQQIEWRYMLFGKQLAAMAAQCESLLESQHRLQRGLERTRERR